MVPVVDPEDSAHVAGKASRRRNRIVMSASCAVVVLCTLTMYAQRGLLTAIFAACVLAYSALGFSEPGRGIVRRLRPHPFLSAALVLPYASLGALLATPFSPGVCVGFGVGVFAAAVLCVWLRRRSRPVRNKTMC